MKAELQKVPLSFCHSNYYPHICSAKLKYVYHVRWVSG